MISSVFSLRSCLVQYASLADRYSVGVASNSRKNGPTLALVQKFVSSKNWPNLKPRMLSDNPLMEFLADWTELLDCPSGTGFAQKRLSAVSLIILDGSRPRGSGEETKKAGRK